MTNENETVEQMCDYLANNGNSAGEPIGVAMPRLAERILAAHKRELAAKDAEIEKLKFDNMRLKSEQCTAGAFIIEQTNKVEELKGVVNGLLKANESLAADNTRLRDELKKKDAEIARLKACRDGECERIRLGAEPCAGCHVQVANDEIASLRALVNELADALWEENGPSYKKLIAKAREVCNV